MQTLSNRRFLYALVAFNVLPHIANVPSWVSIAAFSLIAWRWLLDIYPKVPEPNKWVLWSLGAVLTVFVWNHFGVVWGEEAATGLLLIFAGLKLFELRTYRDLMIVTYMCFFLLMTKLLDSQSLLMTVYLFVDVILITTLLAHHHSPLDHGRTRSLLKRSWNLTWQSAPFILLLFFLFPRFTTGIGSTGSKSQGRTGFSDQIKPGSISQLVQSDELVFRVTFLNHDQPPVGKMYWRGAVLNKAKNGLEWNLAEFKEAPKVDMLAVQDRVDQEIMIEPTYQKWLFAMDWPLQVEFPTASKQSQTQSLTSKTFQYKSRINNREYYRASSSLKSWREFWLEDMPTTEDYDITNIQTEKLQELAKNLKGKSKISSEIVQKYLGYFQEQNFGYDLSPPVSASLEEFMFEHKVGFCEHFAGALASMLRLSGIASRVVVGFQGGTPSIFDNQWMVRQLDAHAWVEYWNSEYKSWLRVDPTAVIAPQRLAQGADIFLNEPGSWKTKYPTLSKIFSIGILKSFYETKKSWLKVESIWIRFLLTYDYNFQQKILNDVGVKETSRLSLTLGLLLALLVVAGGIYFLWNRQSMKLQGTDRLYVEFCDKLRRKGLPRYDTEGPLAYQHRAYKAFGKSPELEHLFQGLLRAHYGDSNLSAHEFKHYKKQIRSLDIDRI